MPSLEQLIDGLSDPEVYGASDVTVHQTHISVVFVTDSHAYKLKKPLDLGFVDYSTPQKRHQFCEAEVRLNRRLAPDTYLGVCGIKRADGGVALTDAGDPEAFEWVVQMRRLDEADNFLSHLHAGTLKREWMVELGQKMARFHRSCERGEVGRYGSFETIAKNARDNFSQSTEQVGRTVNEPVFDAARDANDAALARLEPLINERDATRHTCDTHGDLRLEHIYRIDGELVVVDCVEFNDAFRYADPVADIAFTVMDLRIRWAEDLADALAEAYFEELPGGEPLLDFYVAYRSAVRAKVHGITAAEHEVDEATRERAAVKSRAHWLFAHSTLAPPQQRPAMVLAAGLPGTGKSTLGRMLAEHANFETIDSDHVRKELAGVDPDESMRGDVDSGIYTAEWTDRTYEACLDRALDAIHAGRRVVVSATFREQPRREKFLRAAHAAGVCGLMLQCELPRSEAVRRIRARRDDASDADVEIYDHVAASWEEPGDFVRRRLEKVSTADRNRALQEATHALVRYGLETEHSEKRRGTAE